MFPLLSVFFTMCYFTFVFEDKYMYMYNVDHTQTSFKFYCPENEGFIFYRV